MEKGDDRRLITKSRCFDFSLVCVDLKVFICVDEYAIDFGIFFVVTRRFSGSMLHLLRSVFLG
jgi:hypothetical protein